jgi:hypothetical protein
MGQRGRFGNLPILIVKTYYRGAEWRNKIGEDFLTLTYQAIND